jgi:hypothetical protein
VIRDLSHSLSERLGTYVVQISDEVQFLAQKCLQREFHVDALCLSIEITAWKICELRVPTVLVFFYDLD